MLATVAALVEFLEQEHVQVKAWRGEGFLHAKTYILNGSVGVGSANFTYAGFNNNRELVMWRQDYQILSDISRWFTRHWSRPTRSTTRLISLLRYA